MTSANMISAVETKSDVKSKYGKLLKKIGKNLYICLIFHLIGSKTRMQLCKFNLPKIKFRVDFEGAISIGNILSGR